MLVRGVEAREGGVATPKLGASESVVDVLQRFEVEVEAEAGSAWSSQWSKSMSEDSLGAGLWAGFFPAARPRLLTLVPLLVRRMLLVRETGAGAGADWGDVLMSSPTVASRMSWIKVHRPSLKPSATRSRASCEWRFGSLVSDSGRGLATGVDGCGTMGTAKEPETGRFGGWTAGALVGGGAGFGGCEETSERVR